tara:strand:+ start:149 stop:379 length:231 start_codon:yes stop_codon:yes gene_type:complete
MKFILIMQMCFIIDGNCSPVFENKKKYETYLNCLIDSHIQSLEVIDRLGDEFVNKQKPVIKLKCINDKTKVFMEVK